MLPGHADLMKLATDPTHPSAGSVYAIGQTTIPNTHKTWVCNKIYLFLWRLLDSLELLCIRGSLGNIWSACKIAISLCEGTKSATKALCWMLAQLCWANVKASKAEEAELTPADDSNSVSCPASWVAGWYRSWSSSHNSLTFVSNMAGVTNFFYKSQQESCAEFKFAAYLKTAPVSHS